MLGFLNSLSFMYTQVIFEHLLESIQFPIDNPQECSTRILAVGGGGAGMGINFTLKKHS